MGQKINPIGLRVGINRTWDSRWFAGRRDYGLLWHEDGRSSTRNTGDVRCAARACQRQR